MVPFSRSSSGHTSWNDAAVSSSYIKDDVMIEEGHMTYCGLSTCRKLEVLVQSWAVPLHSLLITHHPQAFLVSTHSLQLFQIHTH